MDDESINKLQRDVNEIKELLGYIYKYGLVNDEAPKHIVMRFGEIVKGWNEEVEE